MATTLVDFAEQANPKTLAEARRAGFRQASRVHGSFLATAEKRALGFFEKFADQDVSFTDCVSFALMNQHDIERAFTFDRHFALAGFEVWP